MSFRTSIFTAAIALTLLGMPAILTHNVAMASTAEAAADVSGTYTWEGGGFGGGGGGGGGGQTTTLTLKQDGTKLTGTISGRGGDTEIEDGSVDGDTIKFKVTREFNGNKMVTNYSGKVEDKTLKLTVTTSREIEAHKQS